jgi:hypothetical protein
MQVLREFLDLRVLLVQLVLKDLLVPQDHRVFLARMVPQDRKEYLVQKVPLDRRVFLDLKVL